MSHSPIKPWLVCFAAALFFFYEIMQLNMFNVLSAPLMQVYQINSTQLGWVSSAYFYANLVFLLPASIIMERVSTRRYILFMSSLATLATFFFAWTSSLTAVVICRGLVGLGNGVAFLGCMRLAAQWFPPQRLALVMGLIITVAMLGGMAAQAPISFLLAQFGWRAAIYSMGILGLIITSIIFLLVKERVTQEKVSAQFSLIAGLSRAMRSMSNWSCGLIVAFLSFPTMLLGALWGNLYLQQTQGFSALAAGNITAMLFFGLIVGSPLMGLISDRMNRRRLPIVLGSTFMLVFLFIIYYLPINSVALVMIIFFMVGLFSSAQVLSYPVLAETNPPEISSMAMSIPALCLNLSVALAQPLFGWLLHWNWNGAMLNGMPLFSLANYHLALWLLLASAILCIFLACLVKEPFRKQANNRERYV